MFSINIADLDAMSDLLADLTILDLYADTHTHSPDQGLLDSSDENGMHRGISLLSRLLNLSKCFVRLDFLARLNITRNAHACQSVPQTSQSTRRLRHARHFDSYLCKYKYIEW